MRGLFKEKVEYLSARFRTKEGLFEWLISSFIFGYVIVNYNQQAYGFVSNLIPFTGRFRDYLAYLLFGLIILPFGILTTYILTKIFRMFFKNKKVI